MPSWTWLGIFELLAVELHQRDSLDLAPDPRPVGELRC